MILTIVKQQSIIGRADLSLAGGSGRFSGDMLLKSIASRLNPNLNQALPTTASVLALGSSGGYLAPSRSLPADIVIGKGLTGSNMQPQVFSPVYMKRVFGTGISSVSTVAGASLPGAASLNGQMPVYAGGQVPALAAAAASAVTYDPGSSQDWAHAWSGFPSLANGGTVQILPTARNVIPSSDGLLDSLTQFEYALDISSKPYPVRYLLANTSSNRLLNTSDFWADAGVKALAALNANIVDFMASVTDTFVIDLGTTFLPTNVPLASDLWLMVGIAMGKVYASSRTPQTGLSYTSTSPANYAMNQSQAGATDQPSARLCLPIFSGLNNPANSSHAPLFSASFISNQAMGRDIIGAKDYNFTLEYNISVSIGDDRNVSTILQNSFNDAPTISPH